MSNPASRLPVRPSLEQIRKQAKELARSREIALAQAQFLLAKSYGFDSWPKLIHHIANVLQSNRLAQFEQLAHDYLGSYHGDAASLEALRVHFGDSSSSEQRQLRVRDRFKGLAAPEPPTLAEARRVVAREYGFSDWQAFAESLAQPATAAAPGIFTATPPFYRIDSRQNRIELRPPLTDRDWDAVFAIMKEHRITGITIPEVSDRVVDGLAQLEFVTRIEIGGRGFSDDVLLRLKAMPQLEDLAAGGWHSPITDRGLEVLRHLRKLKRFSMGWAQRISDAGAANLAFCDELEHVDLMGTPTGDGTINALRAKPDLHYFKSGKLVTDRGLPLLKDFPRFRDWREPDVVMGLMSFGLEAHNLMIDGSFTDAGLAGLAGLEGVHALSFFWHTRGFSGGGLAALAAMPNLVYLGCDGDKCDDDAMRSIATIPRLRMLMGQGAVAGDDGFIALGTSKSLEYFWGRDCPNFRGRGFAALADLPKLRGLGVSCRNVDDDSLSALPRFPALRQLMPMDVRDEGFRHVGRCEGLEDLWCMYCRETGDGATEHLTGLSRLRSYYAGRTRITDLSLEILGGMPSLEKLEFWEVSGITSEGALALAQLPRLKEVSFDGCARVTREVVGSFPASVRVSLS